MFYFNATLREQFDKKYVSNKVFWVKNVLL